MANRSIRFELAFESEAAYQEFDKFLSGINTRIGEIGQAFEEQIRRAEAAFERLASRTQEAASGNLAAVKTASPLAEDDTARRQTARLRQSIDHLREGWAQVVAEQRTGATVLDHTMKRLGAMAQRVRELAAAESATTDGIERANVLRGHALALTRDVLARVRDLHAAGELSADQARRYAQAIAEAEKGMAVDRLEAEKQVQQFRRRGLQEFRREMRARAEEARRLPEFEGAVTREIEEQVEALRRAVREGDRRLGTVERLRAAEEALEAVRRQGEQAQRRYSQDFRREMRARVTLTEEIPSLETEIRAELAAQVETLRRQVQLNRDNLDAIERLKAASQALAKIDKQREERIRRITRRRQEEVERHQQNYLDATSELGERSVRERVRAVREEIEALEEKTRGDGLLSRILDPEGAHAGIRRLRSELETLEAGGAKAARSALKEARRRFDSLGGVFEGWETQLARVSGLHREQIVGLERIEDAGAEREAQLRRIVALEEQVAATNKRQRIGTGRRMRREQMRESGQFESYNAALQMSRLVQDLPFGLMGIVNNIDMAVVALGQLQDKTQSTTKTLKELFSGAGFASKMLWINAILSAYMILDRFLGITDKVTDALAMLGNALTGTTESARTFKEAMKAAREEVIALRENLSDEEILEAARAVRQQADEYERLFMGQINFWKYWGKARKVLEENKDLLEAEAEILAEREGVTGFDPLRTVKALADFEATYEEHYANLLAIEAEGGEDRKAQQERLIRERARIEEEALSEEQHHYVELQLRAIQAGNDLAAEQLAQLSRILGAQIDAIRARTERQVEDVYRVRERKGTDWAKVLLALAREAERATIEMAEEGLAERLQLIEQERKERVEDLRMALEEFKGTEREKVAFKRHTETLITKAEHDAEEARREARREAAREEMRAREEEADLRRKILENEDTLTFGLGGGVQAEIESAYREMQANVARYEASISEEMLKEAGERNEVMLAHWRHLIAQEEQLFRQRQAKIEEDYAQAWEGVMRGLSDAAQEEAQRAAEIRLESTLSVFDSELGRQRQLLQMQRTFAEERLEAQYEATLKEIEELYEQGNISLEAEMMAYQARLEAYAWFQEAKNNIAEQYGEDLRRLERAHWQQIGQIITSTLSSTLGDISRGIEAQKNLWTEKRRDQLIEQGLTEEEATRKSEEEGRKRFAIQKKIAIAQGVVNTVQAGLSAFAHASSMGGLPAGLAAMAAALAAGYAQVQIIRQQSYEGGASGGGGFNLAALAGGSTPATSSASVVAGSSAEGALLRTGGEARTAQEAPQETSGEREVAGEVRALRADVRRYAQAVEERPAIAVLPKQTALDASETARRERRENVR